MSHISGRRLLTIVAAAIVLWTSAATAQVVPDGLGKIDTIVVIYLENRSFDHLYGNFPGANGLANSGAAAVQTDENGKPYETLPAPLDLRQRPPVPYAAIPETLPNGPFPLHKYYKASEKLGSLIHAFYQQQEQINGGRMDKFALISDAKRLLKNDFYN